LFGFDISTSGEEYSLISSAEIILRREYLLSEFISASGYSFSKPD